MSNGEDKWTPPRDNDKAEKLRLLDIFKRCMGKYGDGKRSLNTLIIGTVGVGKSSLVNSMIAAMSKSSNARYIEYLETGAFGSDKQITLELQRKGKEHYCKNMEEDPEICWPTFTDAAGFQNEENNELKEILLLLLNGYIPNGENLQDVKDFCYKKGIGALRDKYSTYNEYMRIDRIVFVAAADEELPSNLIKCVVDVAKPSEKHGLHFTRRIPLYGVLTKIDKARKKLTDVELKDREDQFKLQLGLGGTSRYSSCINYCEDVDTKGERIKSVLPRLDIPILKILIQVCEQSVTRDPSPNRSINVETQTEQIVNNRSFLSPNRIRNAIRIGLFAVLLLWSFQSQVSHRSLVSECLKYSFQEPELQQICKANKEGQIAFVFYPTVPQIISVLVFMLAEVTMYRLMKKFK